MPRRDGLRGSIFPRGRSWVVSLPLPAHLDERDDDGKRRYLKITETVPDEDTALSRLIELNHEYRTGTLAAPDRQLLADYLTEWLETKAHLAYASQAHLRRHCRIVSRFLGTLELRRLDALVIQRWHVAMSNDPDISTYAARNAHRILSQALKAAVNADRIPTNAAARVTAPKHRPQRHDALEPEDAARFVAFISDPANMRRYRYLGASFWLLLIYSGLRVSEALALPWAAVDADRSRLLIDRTGALLEDGRYGIKDRPKTAAAVREVPLPTIVMTALRSHRATQNRHRLRVGSLWQDRDLIWTREDGSLIKPTTARTQLRSILKRADLPKVTPHGLRHTLGSLMLEDGVPLKTVQELMGHESPAMTLAIYGHSSERSKREAVSSLDRVLRQE